MSKPIMYTTHCPKCNILSKKLQAKHIEVIENEDLDVMRSKGIEHVPYLEINQKLYDFNEARALIDEFDPEIGTFTAFVASKQSE